jgi:Uma2 family endonuclease
MVKNIAQIDPNGLFTYADYLTWQFEERVELIKGKLFKMSPAPSVRHQMVSSRLVVAVGNWFRKQPCQFFHAPFDVRLLDTKKSKSKSKDIYTVVQPDICVVCDESKLDQQGCVGAPDWIIEILSPGSLKHDMKKKYQLYQENGVREYWMVHPTECFVQAYSLQPDGQYGHYRMYTDDEDKHATPDIFPGLNIELEEIFS